MSAATSASMPNPFWTPARLTLALIAVTAVLRLWGAAIIGWGTGEAYYIASARALDWSYFDQPPLSLWIIHATIAITGSEDVAILRLPFVLMFGLSTWLVYLLGARLHSPPAGFYAALILNASVLFSLSIGSWLQPDAPMVLFWLATLWILTEIFFGKGERRPWLYWLSGGLFLGLTFLSKYHALFLLGGAGLYMLLDRDARRWFAHPAPYLALLLALLLFSPVLVWNAQNHWASFSFQGGRALAEEGVRWEGLLRMIWGQLLYMVPWLAIPALVIGVKALLVGPRGRFPATAPAGMAALLAYIGWPPILFFTLVALWSDTEFHFHWQAPGYMMLFILLGGWAATRSMRAILIWLCGSALLTVVILAALVSHAATGWARQAFPGEWEDPTALQLPWTELGEALERRDAFSGDDFVVGLGWIDCGYIDTQLRGRAPLACIGPDPRNLAFTLDWSALDGRDAYLVAHTGDPDWPAAEMAPFFAEIEHLETLWVHRNGFPEIGPLQLYRAGGFAFSGPVAEIEPHAARLRQLPTTLIERIEGAIRNDGAPRAVVLGLDGEDIATVALEGEGVTEFSLTPPPRWSVGLQTRTLEIRDAQQGDPVAFTALSLVRR